MTEDRDLIQPALMTARANLMKDGELTPIMIVLAEEGDIIIGFEWQDADEKHAAMAAVGIRAARERLTVTAVLLVTDAWMLAKKDDSPFPTGSLQHVPGRVEAIVAVLSRGTGDHRMTTQQYERRASGKVRKFDPPIEGDGVPDSGLLDKFWRYYNAGRLLLGKEEP